MSSNKNIKYYYHILIVCLFFFHSKKVDDKTSPNAFNIRSEFILASTNKLFTCPFEAPVAVLCDSSKKYRSFDGTCNNLKQPLLGSMETPHKRLLPPVYEDGFSAPRFNALSGKPLPNPRLVSQRLNVDESNLQELVWSHLWIVFGQFLAHDMVATALTNGKQIFCVDLKKYFTVKMIK